MEERRQDDVDHKRLSVQRITGKKASGLMCQSIYYW